MDKPAAPKSDSAKLVQISGGPDFSKPPTPTFPDANNCIHPYVSPNSELMQPDPACPPKPANKKGDPLTKQEGPRIPSLVQTNGPPDFSKPPTPTFRDKKNCKYQY